MLKTIRAKLLASFILLTVLAIAMSIFSVSKINESASGFKQYREIAKDAVLAGHVQADMLMVRMNVKDYMMNPTDKEVEEFTTYFERTYDLVQQAQSDIQNPERAKLVDLMDEGLLTYKAEFEKVQALMAERNDIVHNNLNVNGKSMEQLLTAIKHSAREDADLAIAFTASDGLRNLLLARLYAVKFIESNAKQDMDRTLQEFAELSTQMHALAQNIVAPHRLQQLAELDNLIETYTNGVKQLNQVINSRNQIRKEKLNVIGADIGTWSEDIKLSIKEDQDRIGPMVQALNDSIIQVMSIVAVVIALFSILIAIFIPRSISRGLASIQTKLAQVSDSGDFSIRADQQREDEIGDMGRSVNELLTNMQNAIEESNKVVTAIARGEFDQRIELDLKGDLDTLKRGINDSADSVNETMGELGKVMESMNNGDFNVKVEADVQGDFLKMVNNVSSTMNSLNATIGAIINVMNYMQQGKFEHRVDVEARGDLLTLKDGINVSMDALENAIKDVTRIVVAQSEGDLTQNIEGEYHGELRVLKDAVNATTERLLNVVTQAVNATQVVNMASNEVSQGALDLSQRVQEQAAALEETSSTMEEMNSAVQNNTEHSKEASGVAQAVQNKTTEGTEVMQQTIQAMNAIQESSHKISDIVTLIDSIAFQTNLLALNAAVEAARAGEHGRGFAVVAGEVRALAQKSAEAAKDITGLINESVTRIDQGTKLASESGEMLVDINASVKDVANMIEQIAQASVQQMEGIEQVHKAVSQIDEVTQQNAALVEQTSAASESMSEQAGILANDMSFFNIGQSAQALPNKKAEPKKVAFQKPDSSQLKSAAEAKAVEAKPAAKPVSQPAPKTEKSDSVPTASFSKSDEEWEDF